MWELIQCYQYEIVIALLSVIVIRNIGDWVIFNMKSGAKIAQVSKIGWFIGWISLILLLILLQINQLNII